MPWMFTTPVAPTLDTGDAAVPTSSTSITTSSGWLLCASFTNTSGVARTVTLTNTAGTAIVYQMDVPVNAMPAPLNWTFQSFVGLKWLASGSGVVGHVTGYLN